MHINNQYDLPLNRYPKTHIQSTTISPPSRIMNKKQQHLEETKMYHHIALQNFPFGKQCIKISDYVTSKLNNKEQEDNARILEEFRKKAIQDKFHNKYGKNSRIINQYITENMMPGVTLNPSMVKTLEPQLNPSQLYEYSSPKLYYSQTPSRQHDYPENGSIDQFYNNRRKVSLPQQTYKQPISHTLNPEKQTRECQTMESRIKSYNEIDCERKYYKMKWKHAKKGHDSIDKVESMLHSLNKQIRKNSKFLQNVITDNHDSICHASRKSQSFSVKKNICFEDKKLSKKSHSKYKTETKSYDDDDQETQAQSPDWKLNKAIVFNSTQESFLERTDPNQKRAKPTVDYSATKKKKRESNISNFLTPYIPKKGSSISNYEMTRDYKLKNQQGEKPDINKIRQRLKLLKKHANRLDTISSHSLVH